MLTISHWRLLQKKKSGNEANEGIWNESRANFFSQRSFWRSPNFNCVAFLSYRLETVSKTPTKNSMTEIQTGMEMFYDKYMIVSDGILPWEVLQPDVLWIYSHKILVMYLLILHYPQWMCCCHNAKHSLETYVLFHLFFCLLACLSFSQCIPMYIDMIFPLS